MFVNKKQITNNNTILMMINRVIQYKEEYLIKIILFYLIFNGEIFNDRR